MSFRDYSNAPASNTLINGIFIGPNMERAKVRPALQQLAADGREAWDEIGSQVGGLRDEFTEILAAGGYHVVAAADASATGNVNVANPGTAVYDGVTLTSGQRLLLPAQTVGSQNGIYTFNGSSSALMRVSDFADSTTVVTGAYVRVLGGDTNVGAWVLTTQGTITVGTTAQTWRQFSSDALAQLGSSNTSKMSALVRFLQSGVATLLRTVLDKLRDHLDIRDFTGNDPTGVADSSAAFTAAVTEALNTGKPLRLSRGIWRIDSPPIPSGLKSKLTIYGDGIRATKVVSNVVGASTLDIGNSEFCTIRDFTLQGNGLTGGTGNGHAIRAANPVPDGTPYYPAHLRLERLFITGFKGNDTDSSGSAMGAAGVYAMNALSMVAEDLVFLDCGHWIYLRKCFQPTLVRPVGDTAMYSGFVTSECEVPRIVDPDCVGGDTSAPSGLITPQGAGVSQRAGGVVDFQSRSYVLQKPKVKNQTNAGVSFRSAYMPQIQGGDVKVDADGQDGIRSYWGMQCDGVTFVTASLTGTRRFIRCTPDSGYDHIGQVTGCKFPMGAGGLIEAFVEVTGAGSNALSGTIEANVFGQVDAMANSTTVANVVKVTGNIGSLAIRENRTVAPTNCTMTTVYNLPTTAGAPPFAAAAFHDNPITTAGGTVTTQVSGLPAPYSTNGNTVDSAGFRWKRPSLYAEVAFDCPTIAAGGTQQTTLTVTGARQNDLVTADLGTATTNPILVQGRVTSNDTVTVTLFNGSGVSIDPGNGILSAIVWPRSNA